MKTSRFEVTLVFGDDEDDEDDECLDECFDDELLEDECELELAPPGPSGGSNANTTSLKWPTSSGSFRKRSLHILATSSGGFPKPDPRPNVPILRLT